MVTMLIQAVAEAELVLLLAMLVLQEVAEVLGNQRLWVHLGMLAYPQTEPKAVPVELRLTMRLILEYFQEELA